MSLRAGFCSHWLGLLGDGVQRLRAGGQRGKEHSQRLRKSGTRGNTREESQIYAAPRRERVMNRLTRQASTSGTQPGPCALGRSAGRRHWGRGS